MLSAGDSVALHGPAGVGRTALLDAVEEAVQARGGAHLVRVSGSAQERTLAFAAVHDLLDQVPPEVAAALPEPVRERLRSRLQEGLRGGSAESGESRQAELAGLLRAVLEQWSSTAPVLLLIDDVLLLDPESSAVVGYARNRLAGRFVLVATIGADPEGAARPDEIDVSELRQLEVPPLDSADMVGLLVGLGLGPDVAQRVAVESGGLPGTALALAGALGERPGVLDAPAPLPASVARGLAARLRAQPAGVQETLAVAALLHRPTLRQLERAGLLDAEADLRHAALAGLVHRGELVRFTPTALRQVAAESLTAAQRAERHRALAEAARSRPERLRHLALADPRPDAGLAREVAAGAAEATASGSRDLGAELFCLAAERAPSSLHEERTDWLTQAVESAAPGNHRELVSRALADFWESGPTPDQAVRVRLAIPELAGGATVMLDEVLAAALADAGEDDRRVARVLLQRARVALRESRPVASARDAERAVAVLERIGDPDELALGLTTLAGARRWLGEDHLGPVERAVALAGPPAPGLVHISPAYMAARFAFYDDRLDEAWSSFAALLAQVDRGAAADEVHVLRCLVEVGVRRGRCREARGYAERAERLGEEFDLDPQTAWFISALAELAGGDLARGTLLAARGADTAEKQGDTRYLIRHLGLLGQARLRSGEAAAARAALLRIREVEEERGFSDPTVNRWHADLASAQVALGRLEEAETTLAQARDELAPRTSTGGVLATLDRAEAELAVARGDLDRADRLLTGAAAALATRQMPIELGRTLMVRALLERRRRRVAAGRAASRQALDAFELARAEAWVSQLRGAEPDRARAGDPRLARLNDTERRIAHEVSTGASNREIAERTYLSVKTVEATLTRIYRKLDVRSRTQLAALMRTPPPAG